MCSAWKEWKTRGKRDLDAEPVAKGPVGIFQDASIRNQTSMPLQSRVGQGPEDGQPERDAFVAK